MLFFTTLRTSYSRHTPHVLLFSWGEYRVSRVSYGFLSKFQPNDEGGVPPRFLWW